MAKLADAPDLGSGGEILRGSSPLPGTSIGEANALYVEIGGAGRSVVGGKIRRISYFREAPSQSEASQRQN